MWFMKWSNDEKLKAIHWMMCFLNLTIILFISVIMYITTLRICDMYEARTFLSTLPCLPSNPLRIMITSVACFPHQPGACTLSGSDDCDLSLCEL